MIAYLFGAFLLRLHNGGYVNVLMLIHLVIAMITSRAMYEIFQTGKLVLHTGVCFLIVCQMCICFYNSLTYLLNREDLLAN